MMGQELIVYRTGAVRHELARSKTTIEWMGDPQLSRDLIDRLAGNCRARRIVRPSQ